MRVAGRATSSSAGTPSASATTRDPVTGKQVYLRATITGTDDAAWKAAHDKVAEFRTQVAKQQSATSTVPFRHALVEWLHTSEIEDSTRAGYVNYIKHYIAPALGTVAVNKIDARTLERFYTELRRCRTHCNGRPFIEKHKKDGPHDCAAEKCKPHVCKPLAASTVRQIHSVISGTLALAERWKWISTNPARVTRRPNAKPPEPDPPSSAEAARLVEAAFEIDDDDWALLVWLTMVTCTMT